MERYELLNEYLKGKLDPQKVQELENALLHDEDLKSQLEYESNVNEAVKRFKTAELKARMNNIDVKSGYSNLSKIAASLLFISSVTIGAYYYLKPESVNSNVVSKQPVQEINTEVKVLENTKPSDTKTNLVTNEKVAKSKSNVAIKDNSVPVIKEHSIDDSEPVSFETNDENQISSDNVNDINTVKNTEVSVLRNSSKDLMYKHSNSKLFLIGNFEKKYELIALKSNHLYLKYNNKFYLINENVEVATKLEEVLDSRIVKILNEKSKDITK